MDKRWEMWSYLQYAEWVCGKQENRRICIELLLLYSVSTPSFISDIFIEIYVKVSWKEI